MDNFKTSIFTSTEQLIYSLSFFTVNKKSTIEKNYSNEFTYPFQKEKRRKRKELRQRDIFFLKPSKDQTLAK